MKKYSISNKYKKSFIEYETYEKIINDTTYTFTVELGWRYGSIKIEVPDEYTKEQVENTLNKLYEKEGLLNIENIPFDWSIDECIDGCNLEYEIPDNIPDTIREELEEHIVGHGILSVEEIGWYEEGCRYEIIDEYELKEVE